MTKDTLKRITATRKPNRSQKRSQQTRQAIVVAASEIFLQKGVRNTTVTDITDAADVGYGTFYHHFHSLDDVVSAVAEATMRRVVSIAASILPEKLRFELGPAVCARIFIRYLSKDLAIRCLLERPYVFVDEWHRAVTPFVSSIALQAATEVPEVYANAFDYQSTLRIGPWLIIAELNHAIEIGDANYDEEQLANMFTQLLGVDHARRLEIVERSRQMLNKAKLP